MAGRLIQIVRWRTTLSILGMLWLANTAWGQQAELSGFVKDPSDGIVANAVVSIRNVATARQQTRTTNDAGVYVFPSLDAGVYRLTVDAPGFEKKVIDEIRLEVAAKAVRTIVLNVGTQAESVTVDGSGVNVNTVDASVSTAVDRRFVENVPLNGRSFQSLLTMIPGATAVPSSGTGYGGEITVNGQRTEANYFTVDGVSANTGATATSNGAGGGFSGSTPGQTALGTTQSLVSIDALQEFRAITSTYSAEYGRTPGGQFSFTTRSGTNDWHGSAFDYFRNDVLDANNWFNNRAGSPKPAERQNDFGGTLGGPIRIPRVYDGRNRSFFFFSWESLRLRAPQPSITMDVPSLALRQAAPAALQPFLNAFPRPNGPDSGNGLAGFASTYSNPSTLDSVSIRIDHSINDAFRIFGRYSDSPSQTTSRNTLNLAVLNPVRVNVKTATVGATNIFSPRLSNDLRLNVTGNDQARYANLDTFGGAVPVPSTNVPGIGDAASNWYLFGFLFGTNPQLFINPIDNRQRQINVVDSMTFTLGRHSLKWGVDYRRLLTSEFIPGKIEYGYFGTQDQVLRNVAQQVTLYRFTNGARPVYMNFSGYVQDEWKATQRLSLSLGLRWDLNPAPRDDRGNDPYTITSTDLSSVRVAPRGTVLWKTTYRNFAPRLGIAYQLRRKTDYDTVLRTGVGLFYDTGNTQGSQGYNGLGNFGTASLPNVAFPLTQSQLDSAPYPGTATPYTSTVVAFDPDLKLPYSLQWNLALEQMLGSRQTLTVNYVGSVGRRLLAQRFAYPGTLGNPNFGATGALSWTANAASSDYHSLQAQLQRRLSHGFQALASYTWSHSLDNASSNFAIYSLMRASSNFDVRHNFQTALTYDLPVPASEGLLRSVAKGWAADARITARSSLPLDIVGSTGINPANGAFVYFPPTLVPGQPLYVNDSNAPGGRRVNYNAFTAAPAGSLGNAGRNLARGFSAVQADLAVRRDFRLSERGSLQLRAEAFNIFNHPSFGSIYNQLSNGPARFGYAYTTLNGQLGGLNSLYQTGGPRSIEFAVRLRF